MNRRFLFVVLMMDVVPYHGGEYQMLEMIFDGLVKEVNAMKNSTVSIL